MGAVVDVATGEPCTLNQLEQIRDRVYNPNNMWKIPVWWYAINDQRIYHTVTNVTIDVCTYARLSADSLNLAANILLPDSISPAYSDGALMQLCRDDEFLSQGQYFGQEFNKWLTAIRQGLTAIDSATDVIQNPRTV